jgi:hypothetical protein
MCAIHVHAKQIIESKGINAKCTNFLSTQDNSKFYLDIPIIDKKQFQK